MTELERELIDPEAKSFTGAAKAGLLITQQPDRYADAWRRLLIRVEEKTSWGRNELKQLFLECLINPNP